MLVSIYLNVERTQTSIEVVISSGSITVKYSFPITPNNTKPRRALYASEVGFHELKWAVAPLPTPPTGKLLSAFHSVSFCNESKLG